MVGTLAGNGTSGFADGAGSFAAFSSPNAAVLSLSGTSLYVCDTGNHRVRVVDVTTGKFSVRGLSA
jgi:sugar lactone lactonase YvrE